MASEAESGTEALWRGALWGGTGAAGLLWPCRGPHGSRTCRNSGTGGRGVAGQYFAPLLLGNHDIGTVW